MDIHFVIEKPDDSHLLASPWYPRYQKTKHSIISFSIILSSKWSEKGVTNWLKSTHIEWIRWISIAPYFWGFLKSKIAVRIHQGYWHKSCDWPLLFSSKLLIEHVWIGRRNYTPIYPWSRQNWKTAPGIRNRENLNTVEGLFPCHQAPLSGAFWGHLLLGGCTNNSSFCSMAYEVEDSKACVLFK